MQGIKYKSVSNSQSAVLTHEFNALLRGEFMPLATVVKHGESVIVAFHKQRENGCGPTNNGHQGKNQNGQCINRLPKRVAQGQLNATNNILAQLLPAKRIVLALDNGFCFLAQIGKYRRT